MLDLLLSGPYLPFSLALGLMAGLFLLELLAQLVGGSLLGGKDSDLDLGAEVADAGGAFDLDPGATPDVEALLEASEGLASDSQVTGVGPAGGTTLASLLGLGEVPVMIWLAALLVGFGIAGLAIQTAATAVGGAALPGLVAALPAAVVAVVFARSFARGFAAILPQTETTATRAQFMGGLRGTVSQGVARSGSPAEVRIRDRHGNIHYMRCEPLIAGETIPEGADVLLVRERRGPGDWALRILQVPS